MQTLTRWCRFNLIGALGMGVQLASLACFNHLLHGRYLLASAGAIELTLLHNFAWHWHYTWRDRRVAASPLRPLLRFHLSNGLLSMLGNLALMRVLVQQLHLPLLQANVLAIANCSLVNFWIGDRWVFASKLKYNDPRMDKERDSLSMPSAMLALLLLLMSGAISHAQTSESSSTTSSSSLPSAPLPAQTLAVPSALPITYHVHASDSYRHNAGAFCGVGASTSTVSTKPTLGCGVGFTFIPFIFFEAGVMAPQANRSYLSGYISLDTSIPLARPTTRYLPVAIAGYSRLFETGHAFDYGLALALPRPGQHKETSNSLRIELRDYWTFANPTQHNVMLRVGWMGPASD